MAERIIANLTLDTYQRNKIPPLVIPQHDYGARYIRVRITEQGENVSAASGSVVSIIAKRMADGQSAAFSGSVNADGSVLVPVTQWMLDAPSDDVDCHVTVTGTGYQYSTTSFVISPQERENPSYLEEDDPRVNIVEEALIKVVEEADRAEEQANLAASNAKAEVEKLVGELGVVQETGVSITSVMSQGASSRSFANAIKGEESGGAVLCEEVSPVLHPVVVGVRSRNLFNNNASAWDFNGTYYYIQLPNAGTYTATITKKTSDNMEEVFIGFCQNPDDIQLNYIWLVHNGNIVESEETVSGYNYMVIYTTSVSLDNALNGFEIQVNKGPTALPYTPNVPNGTAVKVTSAGANLIPFPFIDSQINDGAILDGISYTITNGKIVINGTSTYSGSQRVCRVTIPADGVYSFRSNAENASGSTYQLFGNTNGEPFYGEFTNRSLKKGDEFVLNIITYKGVTASGVTFLPMLNIGSTALPDEPFKAGQTIDTTVGSTIDLPSIAPYMSVYTNTEGTAVDVTYVKDTNAVVQKLVNAIVALGGNV